MVPQREVPRGRPTATQPTGAKGRAWAAGAILGWHVYWAERKEEGLLFWVTMLGYHATRGPTLEMFPSEHVNLDICMPMFSHQDGKHI